MVRMTSADLSDAWAPLPPKAWDGAAARHVLMRAGWSATPSTVQRALDVGLEQTLELLFPGAPARFDEPESVAAIRADHGRREQAVRNGAEADRRDARRELRETYRKAQMDLSLAWLQFAADPSRAAREKWALFLSDIYVVAAAKVRNPAMLQNHLALLRTHGLGSAPTLTKAVSRSPAMIEYLDLQRSKRDAPNENFARELFELFVLGQGNYTEADIKNAARAFTGYRQRRGEFSPAKREHDTGPKTVFGHTGRFDGDDVIDLAYRQPAASRFLPAEMARFYLTADPLPTEQLESLGAWWRGTGFDLRQLALRFFGSRTFFAPAYRASYIKSPIQLYLGLLQDLQLDVVPLPRATLRPLQLMGQEPFNPPNVRGWIGGRAWINSATLAARRQTVLNLFAPLQVDRLNADELSALRRTQAVGRHRFTVDDDALAQRLAGADPQAIARQIAANFLPAPVNDGLLKIVTDGLLEDDPHRVAPGRLARVLEVVLQSPDYQLC